MTKCKQQALLPTGRSHLARGLKNTETHPSYLSGFHDIINPYVKSKVQVKLHTLVEANYQPTTQKKDPGM